MALQFVIFKFAGDRLTMSKTKVCAHCNGEDSVMYRVQYKSGKTWCFLCKTCVNEVKPDNPLYRYGGTWKG